jgi:hypothetical protein
MNQVSVFERASRYVTKMDAAVAGSRGHDATFSVASVLVHGFSLGQEDALAILRQYNLRCSPAWSEAELAHKVRSAMGSSSSKGVGYLLKSDEAPYQSKPYLAPAAAAPLEYDPEKLKSFAGALASQVDDAWLANRSPLDPSACTSVDFLSALYDRTQGEKVLVFTQEFSQGEAVWPDDPLPTEGPQGVWFLAQPVTGESLPNPRSEPPGKLSRRIAECVTAWRFLVLESDEAPSREWLGAVVQLPLRIAAIYTSGARSIHVLVQVDALSRLQWEEEKKALLRGMVTLGACRGSLSSVRLTRLPSCLRLGKARKVEDPGGRTRTVYEPYPTPGHQKLLYLAPNPRARAICSLVPVRNVVPELEEAVAALYRATERPTQEELVLLLRRCRHLSRRSAILRSAVPDIEELLS